MLAHDASLTIAIWEQFCFRVGPALGDEDDVNFWSVAVGHIIADAEFLCKHATADLAIVTEIGRCSHWLRPHQSRWAADGGFTWPSGYGGSGYSLHGLPEFDWSLIWQWNGEKHTWECTSKPTGKRRLRLRVAIPSRTSKHNQAAIHTIWDPGCPTSPRTKLLQFYGLRKHDDAWLVTAYQCNDHSAYEFT